MKHIKEVLDETVGPVLKQQMEQNVKMALVIEDCITELKRLKASLEKTLKNNEMGD